MLGSLGINLLAKIIDEDNYKLFGKLQRKWFEDIEQGAYDFVYNFVRRYNKFPSLKIFYDELSIEELEITETSQYYFDKLIERYKRILLESYLPYVNKKLEKRDIDGAIKEFENIIDTIKSETSIAEEHLFSYRELLETSLELSISNRIKTKLGITTGWKTLDEATGGFTNGNFYAIVARVKMGKSLVISRMAQSAYKEGRNVLFVSLEMPAIEIADRLLGLEFGLNKKYITHGRLSTFTEKEVKEELRKFDIENKFWFVDGKFNKTVDDITFTCKQLKPDIVFIDGAYLLRVNKSFKAKWELVTYTAEQLKFLAMDLSIPVVASYQFNRQINRKASSVKDKGFENIGLSDAISQLASIGIALIAPEGTDDYRTVEVIGARDGGECSFDINWDWEKMNFDEVSNE